MYLPDGSGELSALHINPAALTANMSSQFKTVEEKFTAKLVELVKLEIYKCRITINLNKKLQVFKFAFK